MVRRGLFSLDFGGSYPPRHSPGHDCVPEPAQAANEPYNDRIRTALPIVLLTNFEAAVLGYVWLVLGLLAGSYPPRPSAGHDCVSEPILGAQDPYGY